MSLKQQNFFEFGEFRLDARQRVLCAADRSEIPLAPKVFETLQVLVENHSVILDKDYLLKRIWPDAFVEEGSLARNISILRRALGESPDDQRYIQTIPKRGYRFIAPVKMIPDHRGVLVVEEQTTVQATFDVEMTGASNASEATTGSATGTTGPSQPLGSQVAPAKRGYLQWSLAGLAIAAIVATTAGVTWYRKPPDRQVMRLEMSVSPADALVDLECPVVALSPDGSRVVYVASQGNIRQLYLRAMDNKEAKPIPGTEGAYCTPFFSPDGQWLGFFSSGSLKKVSLSGGSPINIVNGLGGVLGATWGDDGNIVFASRVTRGIERISESGESRQFVTTVSPDRGESTHRWPVLLPGSKALLYTIGKESGADETEIVVQRLDTGERRVLIPGGTFPKYLPAGQLVYIQNGSLMAVDFDARQLEVRGVPVPIEERVRQTGLGAAQFGFSRLGSLVYVSSEGPDAAANNESLVWVDRKGNATPIGAPLRGYERASLSPDGQMLAVSINGAAKADTWLYDLSRHVLTRLTFGFGFNRFPVWTPDGKRVVFVSTRTSVPQVFWKAADGSGTEDRISMNADRITIGSISPDGAVLLYSVEDPKSGADIWIMELSGTHKSRPFLQTPFAETAPAISPDGLRVAYVSNESGRNEIFVRPLSGSGQKWQLSTDGGEQPVWAHSGRELFYINGSKMLAVPMTTAHFSPETFVAGVPQVLFDQFYKAGNAPWPSFSVSLDDQRFLMIRQETATRVNVVLNLFNEFR
jgi:eukaryotic-like serine/threonine-protein kinase